MIYWFILLARSIQVDREIIERVVGAVKLILRVNQVNYPLHLFIYLFLSSTKRETEKRGGRELYSSIAVGVTTDTRSFLSSLSLLFLLDRPSSDGRIAEYRVNPSNRGSPFAPLLLLHCTAIHPRPRAVLLSIYLSLSLSLSTEIDRESHRERGRYIYIDYLLSPFSVDHRETRRTRRSRGWGRWLWGRGKENVCADLSLSASLASCRLPPGVRAAGAGRCH